MNWAKSALEALSRQETEAAMAFVSSQQLEDHLLPIKFHLLGLAAIQLDNFAEALALFKKASDANPSCRIHFDACGFCAARLGMLSDSMFYMKMSTTCEEPSEFENSLMPEWLGSIEDQLSNIEERPFLQKAQEAYSKQKFEEVLSHLNQALNADPFAVDSWLLIHKTMGHLGRKFDALQAVLAAKDSGEVNAEMFLKAANLATGMTISDVAQDLFIQARDQAEEDEQALVDWGMLVALSLMPTETGRFKEFAKNWIEEHISDEIAGEEISPLKQRLKLGIYSSCLEAGKGQDPYVNFIYDLVGDKSFPWLQIKTYSASEFEDSQIRRVSSLTKTHRNCHQIDHKTLGRIMKNDGLHVLWDLDGISLNAAPTIHNETSIPLRWINGNSDKDFEFSTLNGKQNIASEIAPMAFPAGVSWDKSRIKKREGRCQIALSLELSEITDSLLSMLQDLRRQAPDFVLRLDTEKLGGVSFVEHAEKRFVDAGLGNFIEFVQPVDFIEKYNEDLYGKADFLLLTDSQSALQVAHDGAVAHCRILGLNKENALGEAGVFLKQFGLADCCFEDEADLLVTLLQEIEDETIFRKSLEFMIEQLQTANSSDEKQTRQRIFMELILAQLPAFYGDNAPEILRQQGGK